MNMSATAVVTSHINTKWLYIHLLILKKILYTLKTEFFIYKGWSIGDLPVHDQKAANAWVHDQPPRLRNRTIGNQ